MGRGQQPTIRAIREALGTGSLNTVHKHLAAWREARAETEVRLTGAERSGRPVRCRRGTGGRAGGTGRADRSADQRTGYHRRQSRAAGGRPSCPGAAD
jgi:SOS-response transcriptional repressor LexA